MITGIGVHDRVDRLFTITGIRKDRHLRERPMDVHADDTHSVPAVVQGSKQVSLHCLDVPPECVPRASIPLNNTAERARRGWPWDVGHGCLRVLIAEVHQRH